MDKAQAHQAERGTLLVAPESLSEKELTPIFALVKQMSNHYPQVLDSAMSAALHGILATPNPEYTFGRFLFTPLPATPEFGDLYATAANASHAPKGIRLIAPEEALKLWEREKQGMFAFLLRVFFKGSDYIDFKLKPEPIIALKDSLEFQFTDMGRNRFIPGFNKELTNPLVVRLEQRMRDDRAGMEALRVYTASMQEILTLLASDLLEYRNGFAPIYADYRRTGDEHAKARAINTHTSSMRERTSTALSQLFIAETRDPEVMSRLFMILDLLRNSYYRPGQEDAQALDTNTEAGD